MEAVKRKTQEGQAKIQIEQQKAAAEAQHGQVQAALDHQGKADALQAKFSTDMAKITADHRARMAELAVEVPLEKYAIDKKAAMGQGKLVRPK
jgi:hypothetical protein